MDSLRTYADSSFASKMGNSKSVSGGAVLHGDTAAAVMWLSRKHLCVTLSSTEPEHVLIGECVKEVVMFLR